MGYARLLVLPFSLMLLFSGCAVCPPVDPKQKLIMHFDDHLIPLSKAVDVVADKLPPAAIDGEVFSVVTERRGNSDLLEPFKGYILKARIQDGTGVILLCSPDGKEGMIEDVSCTTRPDSHRPSGSPCAFMLDVKRVCSTP